MVYYTGNINFSSQDNRLRNNTTQKKKQSKLCVLASHRMWQEVFYYYEHTKIFLITHIIPIHKNIHYYYPSSASRHQCAIQWTCHWSYELKISKILHCSTEWACLFCILGPYADTYFIHCPDVQKLTDHLTSFVCCCMSMHSKRIYIEVKYI